MRLKLRLKKSWIVSDTTNRTNKGENRSRKEVAEVQAIGGRKKRENRRIEVVTKVENYWISRLS
jgi:hypothetical protein